MTRTMPRHRRRAGRNLSLDMALGRAIRRLRLAAGKSQAELGDAIGVSFQAVQKYESGENRVSATRLVELSRYFQVPLAEFLAEAEADEAPLPAPRISSKWVATTLQELSRLKPAMRVALLDLLRALNTETEATINGHVLALGPPARPDAAPDEPAA
jgi:transcriptional regulator with XRE-family HTH domain